MKMKYILPQAEEKYTCLNTVLIGSSEQDPWADAKERDEYYDEEELYLLQHNSSSNEYSLW